MLVTLHPDNPNPRSLRIITECLREGGVIIYPTDTVYGLGCDIYKHSAIERICRIKGLDPGKAQLSLLCADLSRLSDFTRSMATPLFRLLKRSLPGPCTFILPASRNVPKLLKTKKNTVGIRVPDNTICRSILRVLGNPVISTSIPGEFAEEFTDPVLIHERFKDKVDIVVDGGPGGLEFSTVVDCTGERPVVIRQGRGILEELS